LFKEEITFSAVLTAGSSSSELDLTLSTRNWIGRSNFRPLNHLSKRIALLRTLLMGTLGLFQFANGGWA